MDVEATAYAQTHIILPEDSVDVLWTAKKLWDVDSVKNHIFINSTTDQPQGQETTLSAVGGSNNSYEFRIHRVRRLAEHCYVVKSDGAMVHREVWRGRDAAYEQRIAELAQQVSRANVEKAQAQKDGERQAREAIKKYRQGLNTNYEWTEGAGWYAAGGSNIHSVHDDGRFTYIVLNSDNRGIMSIQSEIDGKTEMLESTYNAAERTYTVPGIFPKFKLRAGDSEVVITRKGV